jgi:hypothetical protein
MTIGHVVRCGKQTVPRIFASHVRAVGAGAVDEEPQPSSTLKGKAEMRCAILTTVVLGTLVSQPTLAFSQNGATPNSSQTAQMPGRLVDVGGWRLHLHCEGDSKPGQPTVVLEAGGGDFSVTWALVQPKVATFARVCSYDRSGSGWSDLGPNP